MEYKSTWKIVTCGACAVAVGGVCVIHSLKLSKKEPEPVLFYQSHEHPERQPVPQPPQEISGTAMGTSTMSSFMPRMFFASGDLVGNLGAGSATTFSIARSTDITAKSA
jgi:hypothetical protein